MVQALVANFGEQLSIVPIPGASAVTAALSASGFPSDQFVFMGFPPHKKGRESYFDRVAAQDMTVAFYESTHRIMKTMESLGQRIGDRPIVVARELTKLHETIYRGTAQEVTEQLESTSIKGEFVVILRAN